MTSRRRFLAGAAAFTALAPHAARAEFSIKTVLSHAELSRVGPVDEFKMGRAAAAALVDGKRLMKGSAEPVAYARQVLDTLALRSRYPYSYRGPVLGVIEDREINAYAAPGPFIFITTGMLRFLRDEEELAAILGHELAHAELQHAVYQYRNGEARRTFDLATDGGFKDLFDDMMPAIVQGYSIEIEAEADSRAIDLVNTAGYRPAALIEALERFKSRTNSYGGAQYPQQRTAMLVDKVKPLLEPNPVSVALRTERFRRAMRSLPRNA